MLDETQKKPQTTRSRSFLFAAMLGFARAAQLAPRDDLLVDTVAIELPAAHQPRYYEDLPLYHGRLDELSSDDLVGTGDLVKLYSSTVFRSGIEFASIRLLTSVMPLSSGLFQAYDLFAIDECGKGVENGVLPAEDVVLFASERTGVERQQILTANKATLEEVVGAISQEFGRSPDFPPEAAQAVMTTLSDHRELLVESLHNQLQAVRNDLVILSRELINTQRAFAETVETLQRTYDLKALIRETSRRLTEEAIDQTVVLAAKQAARVLVKAIAAALL